jgi:hypothetical protein
MHRQIVVEPYEAEATVGGLPGHWLEQTEGRKKTERVQKLETALKLLPN